MSNELSQSFWERVDQVMREQFDCRLVWGLRGQDSAPCCKVRPERCTDKVWDLMKADQPTFIFEYFTCRVPVEVEGDIDEFDHTEVEFVKITNIDADSGYNCIVQCSPTAVAALLNSGW